MRNNHFEIIAKHFQKQRINRLKIIYFYLINQGRKNNNLVKNKIPGNYIFWGELQYKFNLKQIEKITEDLKLVQNYIAEILADIEDGKKDLADSTVAEKYLFITQKMSVSFFPQNGTFNQLISTGSIELIDSKEFRRVLLNNYTHYYDRNSANNRTLDDLYLAFGANIDPKITVTSTEQDDASFIYSDMVVSSYDIDQKFYLSNTFKAYLLTAQSMVGKNIDMLKIFSESYKEIIALANNEIS